MNPFQFENRSINRRHLLRSAGASIALPLLGAMTSAFGHSRNAEPINRFVAMNAGLGFHTPFLFPEKPGRNYKLSPYLGELKDHIDQLTVVSGLSHPNQNGNNGHASHMTWLTSAPRPGLTGFKNTVSLDQLIAAKVGKQTRLPFLALTSTGGSLSWDMIAACRRNNKPIIM